MYKLLFILLIGLIGFQVALGQKEEESERRGGFKVAVSPQPHFGSAIDKVTDLIPSRSIIFGKCKGLAIRLLELILSPFNRCHCGTTYVRPPVKIERKIVDQKVTNPFGFFKSEPNKLAPTE
ncbi:unnamed protein product [Acanthoscelides obtectus]|uniref:Uncharacterized protein n=1 Tax=Acanthoscelides obtectus TaxID=200917 RepID=A0A9P0P3E2_ACAOB|nr:unnamed protein product [Acanthoscelides obtectus]CAK1632328.1 hypothetical protein AOBTE_LOCUS7485 [Acanthoscelides obtectus]